MEEAGSVKRRAFAADTSLREWVYDALSQALDVGELAPGTCVRLEDLEKHLGVGATPVRDALLQLEAEGLVRLVPRRGCLVRSMALEDLRSIYQILGALEATVVQDVGERLVAMVPAMGRWVEEMRHCLDRDDSWGFYEANRRLHDTYMHLSKNSALCHVVQTQKKRLYGFLCSRLFVKRWDVSAVNEHRDFVELVARGNLNEAAAFVREVHWAFPS